MNKRRKCDKNTYQYSKPPHTNLQGNWSTGFSVYRGWTDTHTDRRYWIIHKMLMEHLDSANYGVFFVDVTHVTFMQVATCCSSIGTRFDWGLFSLVEISCVEINLSASERKSRHKIGFDACSLMNLTHITFPDINTIWKF